MSVLRRVCLITGGLAMFMAVLLDFGSVVARHVGLRAVGSLEISQFCITALISSAVVLATLEGAHASVHLLVTRVGPQVKVLLERLSEVLTFVAFAGLAAGDIWVASELLPLDERSDLLHLPFAPARLLWSTCLAVCAILAVLRLFRSPRLDPPADV